MKKRSLWILFISALLCLSMLFAACDSGEKVDTEAPNGTETGTGAETEPETGNGEEDPSESIENETDAVVEIPEDEKVDYAAILTEWSNHITSVGMQDDITYTSNATYMFETNQEYGTPSAQIYGKIAAIVMTEKVSYTNPEDGTIVEKTKYDRYFVNLETGANILSETLSYSNYDFAEGIYLNQYSATVLLNTIIKVEKRTWKNVAAEGEPEQYDWVREYTYYTRNGSKLAVDKEEGNTSTLTSGGINAVIIGDKAYHCKDSDVILVTDKNTAHALPDFPIEYNGYMYLFDSDRVRVADPEYELVVDYTLPSYISNSSYTILSNGDIYYYSTVVCDDGAKDFDVEYEDIKYKTWHIVVSIETGEAKEIDAGFLTVTSVSNFNTSDTGIKLEGEHQLATVVMSEEGKMATELSTVILDKELNIVATLPKLLKNQQYIYSGLGNDKFLVLASDLDNNMALYVADANDGSVTRYAVNASNTVNGGYIYNEKVYNDGLEAIFDLGDVNSGWKVYGGNILYKINEIFEEPDPNDVSGNSIITVSKEITYIGYIDDAGEFQSIKLGEDITVTTNGWLDHGLYHVTGENENGEKFIKIFDLNGREMFSTYQDGYSTKKVTLGYSFDGSVVIIETITGLANKSTYYIIK